jgi:hypothetical protein
MSSMQDPQKCSLPTVELIQVVPGPVRSDVLLALVGGDAHAHTLE